MLLFQKSQDGSWGAIAEGYVYGRYTSSMENGILSTVFTLCYAGSFKDNSLKLVKVKAIGQHVPQYLKYAKEKKAGIVVMGLSAPNRDNIDSRYSDHIIYCRTVFSPELMVDMYNYYRGSILFDEKMQQLSDTDRIAGNIRYDYDSSTNPEDHMI